MIAFGILLTILGMFAIAVYLATFIAFITLPMHEEWDLADLFYIFNFISLGVMLFSHFTLKWVDNKIKHSTSPPIEFKFSHDLPHSI